MTTLEELGRVVAEEERQAELLDELLETPAGSARWEQLRGQLQLSKELEPGALQMVPKSLAPEQEERLMASILAEVRAMQASPLRQVGPNHGAPGVAAERVPGPQAAWAARGARWAGPLLLAAAALLFWLTPTRSEDLPEYELQWFGGAESRGAGSADDPLHVGFVLPLALRSGGILRLAAQPLQATGSVPSLRAWLRAGGATGLIPLTSLRVTALERAPSGALRASLIVPDSLPSSGEIWVVLGTPPPGLEQESSLPPSGATFRTWSRPFLRLDDSE